MSNLTVKITDPDAFMNDVIKWVRECISEEDFKDFQDAEHTLQKMIALVENCYDGGLRQFLNDGK